jgi:hypothetical protein
MKVLKTLGERSNELRGKLATTVGRAQLRDLQAKYEAQTGKPNVVGKSIIEFILASERAQGLLAE